MHGWTGYVLEGFCGAYISEKGLLTIASATKIALMLLIDFFSHWTHSRNCC